MVEPMFAFLRQRSRVSLTALGVLLVAVLGLVDFFTGYELGFALFYQLPIALVGWFAGRGAGLLVAACSALVWLLADLAAGRPFMHPLIPLWNAMMRLGFFVTTLLLLSSLQRAHVQLTDALHQAHDEITLLSGLIPICSWCRKIRDARGEWHHLETYLERHANASVTHGICPVCQQQLGAELRPLE